ncbi:MAG: hypothetical protein AAF664_17860 [Planctomycetota bacterium]
MLGKAIQIFSNSQNLGFALRKMTQLELLRFASSRFDRLEIPWMIVGSHASSFYGVPRSTHDIDVVAFIDDNVVRTLVESISSERHYLSEAAIREGRMAKLIDTQTGDKLDIFLAEKGSVDWESLKRSKPILMLGGDYPLISVEDLILSKLRWNAMSGDSERQLADVRGVIQRQFAKLKWSYLREMASGVGLLAQLESLRRSVESDIE